MHGLSGAAAFMWLRGRPAWLIAAEAVLAASAAIGVRLVGRALGGLALAGEAARLVGDGDLTSHVRPVGDPAVDAVVALYNQMVDRLRAERTRVAEQQQFFRHVLQASPTGLIVLDFDGRVVDANPEAVRLVDAGGDPRGRRLEALPSELARAVAEMPAGATAVVALSGPRRVKAHHGTFVDRGFRRSFLVLDELTDQLREFERASYEKLIRVMSHEVNNTVTAANSLLHSSLAYAAELPPDSRTELERALGIVIGRADQLAAFMRRFAAVFRLPPPHLERHRLVAIVEPAVALIAARADASGIAWRWDVEDPDVAVDVDRAQFEQACVNILANAVEAAGPAGTVTVRIGRTGARPTLAVEDSGGGLSREAAENVFTPFFSTKPGGQGIGLTLVQEILSAHRATFGLDHPPGGPTRFRVIFPGA